MAAMFIRCFISRRGKYFLLCKSFIAFSLHLQHAFYLGLQRPTFFFPPFLFFFLPWMLLKLQNKGILPGSLQQVSDQILPLLLRATESRSFSACEARSPCTPGWDNPWYVLCEHTQNGSLHRLRPRCKNLFLSCCSVQFSTQVEAAWKRDLIRLMTAETKIDWKYTNIAMPQWSKPV